MNPYGAGDARRVEWLGGFQAEADAMSKGQREPGAAG
jgi:hypothetical protein